MNIAICDDQPIICDELERLVDVVFQQTQYDYSYQSFYSGDALLAHLKGQPDGFQIYLLDIEMSGTDGLETARQIRLADKEAVIIFVTSHDELMPKAFRILAFDFLVKPLIEKEVVETIQASVALLEQRNTLFMYAVKKKVYSLYLSQIECLESMGRIMVIHTTDGGRREYYGALKDSRSRLPNACFAQASKSYVVNLEQIAALDSWHLRMRSGLAIDIGKKYHAEFHAAYRRFKLKRR